MAMPTHHLTHLSAVAWRGIPGSPALGVGRGFRSFRYRYANRGYRMGGPWRGLAQLAQLAQPVLADGKRWWL